MEYSADTCLAIYIRGQEILSRGGVKGCGQGLGSRGGVRGCGQGYRQA